jgi:NAD(P)-dependent dehydrogenase (short-subunit alcohol dehydrogenase family)
MSKTILVTGANTGIGFALVRLLAEKGHTVYLGARNEHAGKEAVCVFMFTLMPYSYTHEIFRDQLHADGLTSVKLVYLDVTDAATIHAAKETIEKAEEKLDVLVNNAGTSSIHKLQTIFRTYISSPGIHIEADQNPATMAVSTFRGTMEVNFFGVVQTTVILLPLIRKSMNGGVIVNVSSTLGSNAIQAEHVRNPPIGSGGSSSRFLRTAYSSSKAALNSYTIALAHELKGEGIKVNAVSPGLTSKAGAEVLVPWVLLEKDGPTCTCLE